MFPRKKKKEVESTNCFQLFLAMQSLSRNFYLFRTCCAVLGRIGLARMANLRASSSSACLLACKKEQKILEFRQKIFVKRFVLRRTHHGPECPYWGIRHRKYQWSIWRLYKLRPRPTKIWRTKSTKCNQNCQRWFQPTLYKVPSPSSGWLA